MHLGARLAARVLVLVAAVYFIRRSLFVDRDADEVAAGVLMLAAAGALASLTRRVRSLWWIGAPLAIPGALLIVQHPEVELRDDWPRYVVVILIVAVGGVAVGLCQRWAGTPLVAGQLDAAAIGVFLCVPETDFLWSMLAAFAIVGLGALLLRVPVGPAVTLAGAG